VGWTDVWTLTPILTGHLTAATLPDVTARHLVMTSTLGSRRGWQIRIYGSLTGTPRLSGSLFMGARLELPTSPAYGCQVGVSRSARGLDVTAEWPPLGRTGARTLARAIAAVTPDVAEGFVETVAGVGYGAVPHWLYDPVGRTLADDPATATPTVLPVICASPGGASTRSVTRALAAAGGVTWRERR
jgi:hypothetical protein